jgi:hypothetical protein
MSQSRVARCIDCRGDVSVPDSYEEGAKVSCGQCSAQLKVVRTGGLRLIIADPLALRDTLREVKQDIARLNRELQAAKASWGIGVNGLGIGLLYVIARIFLEHRALNRDLISRAILLSLVVGVLLEAANFLFLAKRQAISQLSSQLKMATAQQKDLERKIRESTRR